MEWVIPPILSGPHPFEGITVLLIELHCQFDCSDTGLIHFWKRKFLPFVALEEEIPAML